MKVHTCLSFLVPISTQLLNRWSTWPIVVINKSQNMCQELTTCVAWCSCSFDFHKQCAQRHVEFCSLELNDGGSLSPILSFFPVLSFSNVKDTSESQVPRLSPGPARLCVPKCTAFLGMLIHHLTPTPRQLPIQKEVGRQAEVAPWAAARLNVHWPFVLLSEFQVLGDAEEVKAVLKQNLADLVSSPSFLFVLLAGSHWYKMIH